MWFYILAILVEDGFLGTAFALDIEPTFYSAEILSGAVKEISHMQEPELLAFTRYLAECQDDDRTNPASKHACVSALRSYELEFGSRRPIDDWIEARSLLLELPPHADLNDPTKLANAAIRYAKVVGAVEEAARSRFHALRSSPK